MSLCSRVALLMGMGSCVCLYAGIYVFIYIVHTPILYIGVCTFVCISECEYMYVCIYS